MSAQQSNVPLALPPLVGPQQKGQISPTSRFRSEYKRRVKFLQEVFPPDQNPQSNYPPAEAEDFIARCYLTAPELQQNLMRELWTLLREIDANHQIVNGRKLYDHQLAHLIWVSLSLTNAKSSPTSFFIEGAPGTGKTLTLGMIMQASIRLQLRGLLAGKLAYCTAKVYHLPAKIRGQATSRRRILRAPPYDQTPKDINRFRLAFRKIDKEFMDTFFRKKDWDRIFAERITSETSARDVIERSMADRNLLGSLDEFETSAGLVEQIAKVVAGKATIVKGPNGAPELLEVLPPEHEDGNPRIFTGDAAFAIPSKDYPVFSNTSLGVAASDPKDARLILVPARLFTSTQQFEKYRDDVHRHIQIVFCDEAQRRNRMTFQEPVHYAGSQSIPLVFAAGSRWYERDWHRRSPSHTFPESIRRGVLPDIGVRVFPSSKTVHFPAETQESLDQAVAEYFRALKFYKLLKIPQPFEGHTLFVVHSRLVASVTNRLRAEFQERKHLNAQIWGYAGNEQDREAFQSWFVTERDGPNVLVSSPAIVKDTLDFPTIRHMMVGTRVSADALYHLIGRLAHSKAKVNANDRVLVSQQQFSNSNLRATPFHALDHGREVPTESFSWLDGKAIISEAAFKRDTRKAKGKEKQFGVTTVPISVRRTRGSALPMKTAEGKPLLPPRQSKTAFPFNQVSEADCQYDAKLGPPSRSLVQAWARACDANSLFEQYSSILLVAEEAHRNQQDPRAAVERKIAQLRERSSRR